ncbi:MAG: hypothetical protein QM784_00505 [Polyangiaceae bacterium]
MGANTATGGGLVWSVVVDAGAALEPLEGASDAESTGRGDSDGNAPVTGVDPSAAPLFVDVPDERPVAGEALEAPPQP